MSSLPDHGQKSAAEHGLRLALISTPWAMYNRPSIQLGALKPFIEANTCWEADCFHPFLDIAQALGTEAYSVISDNSWAGEAVFSALLFREKYAEAESLFDSSLKRRAGSTRQRPVFAKTVDAVEEVCARWLAERDFSRYRLAGLSVCFNQLLASLYISQKIAGLPAAPAIVLGGSSCVGALGKALLETFPWIDFVVDGEGERAMAGLLAHLEEDRAVLPERIYARSAKCNSTPCPEIENLDFLPTPDYDSYHQQLQRVFPDSPFSPVLPVEFSRGCWWNRCTFCNLNLQWHSYRAKSAEKVLSELGTLSKRYHTLDFTFCDNALPVRESKRFFAAMAEVEPDLRFFAEIRGTTSPQTLQTYRAGGLDTIQVGIEALSSSLLHRMKKGTRAIENLAIMKHAMAAGIRLEGNLILEFPGSTRQEVAESMENLEYALPFSPLSAATFFLGHGSPVACAPREFGITATLPHRKNRSLFPESILKSLTLLSTEYRGDRSSQKQLWRPVRDRIRRWQRFHASRQEKQLPALRYREGGNFLIIRQEVIDGPPLRHKLKGLSRQIYLFCTEIRTLDEIRNQFNSIKDPAILAFIDQLCQKRLMFRENNLVLALAIRQRQ